MFKNINQLSISESEKVSRRRKFIEEKLSISLKNIGCFSQDPASIANHNCENMIGCAQIPMGMAGPIVVNGKEYFVPLATTEGALVASVARGCKTSRESRVFGEVREIRGVRVVVEDVGITRGPVFKTNGILQSHDFVKWVSKQFEEIKTACEETSHHLKLLKIENQIVGKNVFLRFVFDTQDAMGMNMATFAAAMAAKYMEENYIGAKLIALSGNYCVDKKASHLNFIKGRGKKVWAEITIDKETVKNILHTTPEKIAEVVYRKCLLGSAISGSLGYNSHYANIVAAIFLATGQDAAHVVEGSLGITTAEVEKNGDLYFSVYLPDLICGTVGGGTGLATQSEALNILRVKNSIEFAGIVGGAVLAGELSLVASLAEGSLARAHGRLGRGAK